MAKVRERIRNGVDTAQLFATVNVIKAEPALSYFQFRATNRWVHGAHTRSTIRNFYAAGQEDVSRSKSFVIDAGEPSILVGSDTGASPAEHLLHALAACMTSAIVYVAAARGIKLTEVECRAEGDLDVRGMFGISEECRTGFQQIRVEVKLQGRSNPDGLRALVERAKERSPVYDVVSKGSPVAVAVAPAAAG